MSHRQGTVPKGGVPQGALLGPKCFLVYINDLETHVMLYKYVDDSTLFEICLRERESVLQHSVDIAARWTLHRVRSGIMSIVLFPANILLHMHPISSTYSAWC